MVLLVIDVQKGITDERLYEFQPFEENLKTLIEASRKCGVEVIYVRHDDGPGSGFSVGDADFEIYDGIAPAAGEKIFDKKVNSALHDSTGLDKYLKSKNIKKVIAVGLQTDYCIDATVKSGFERGYEMIVPEYCNSTRSNPYMDAKTTYEYFNKNMWPGRYATCPTVSETLEMIRNHKKNDNSYRINGDREGVVYDIANISDISELVRLRILYMIDDFGSITDEEREGMEKQLPGYFERELGKKLIAFVARAEGRLVAAAYLLIIEKPANPFFLNGLDSEVLSVYTEEDYRGRGICSQLMKNMIAYATEHKISRIDLIATDDGYPIYKKLGFEDKTQKYKDMRYKVLNQ